MLDFFCLHASLFRSTMHGFPSLYAAKPHLQILHHRRLQRSFASTFVPSVGFSPPQTSKFPSPPLRRQARHHSSNSRQIVICREMLEGYNCMLHPSATAKSAVSHRQSTPIIQHLSVQSLSLFSHQLSLLQILLFSLRVITVFDYAHGPNSL